MNVNKISDAEALERFKEIGFECVDGARFFITRRRIIKVRNDVIHWDLKRHSSAITSIRINGSVRHGVKTLIDAINILFQAYRYVSERGTVKACLHLATRHSWSVKVERLGCDVVLSTNPALIHLIADGARGEPVSGIIWDLLQDLELA